MSAWPRLPPLPAPLLPGRRIPFVLQKFVVERALAVALREVAAGGGLEAIRGRHVRIVVEDAGIDWCLTADARGLHLSRRVGNADVVFRGRLREFVLLASRRADADTLFFQRRLEVTGSTELGLSCKNLLDAIDTECWPWSLQAAVRAAGALASRGTT